MSIKVSLIVAIVIPLICAVLYPLVNEYYADLLTAIGMISLFVGFIALLWHAVKYMS
jgi:hypothetical protein